MAPSVTYPSLARPIDYIEIRKNLKKVDRSESMESKKNRPTIPTSETGGVSIKELIQFWVWAAVRERFCDEVLAHDKHLIAVPNLSQADYFDTYYMFIKEKAGLIASVVALPTYHVIGHMAQVIDLEKSNRESLIDNEKPLNDDNIPLRMWECDVVLDGRAVHVTVDNMTRTAMPLLLEEGELVLKRGIPGLNFEIGHPKSVYIITDVVKAGTITAIAIDDDNKCESTTLRDRQVAFGYSKFSLLPDGVVSGLERTKPQNLGTWDVVVGEIEQYLNEFSQDEHYSSC